MKVNVFAIAGALTVFSIALPQKSKAHNEPSEEIKLAYARAFLQRCATYI